jgi:serine/threonine protein kinase
MPHPTFIDGRYELLDSLGRGGEAEVHRGRDTHTGAEVAVRLPLTGKVFAPSEHFAPPPDPHPGWVRLLDAGSDPQRGPYQIYDLLRGKTLQETVAAASLDLAAWRDFARESLDTVGALHAAGWTHGDLNADNFLQLEAPPRTWKLLELPFFSAVTGAPRSSLFGSIHALSPEQIEGKAADSRSDIYALGCLYYYAAAGEYPHGGENSAAIAIGRLRFPSEPLRAKAPALPAGLADWVMTLLARDPSLRPDAVGAARSLLSIA